MTPLFALFTYPPNHESDPPSQSCFWISRWSKGTWASASLASSAVLYRRPSSLLKPDSTEYCYFLYTDTISSSYRFSLQERCRIFLIWPIIEAFDDIQKHQIFRRYLASVFNYFACYLVISIYVIQGTLYHSLITGNCSKLLYCCDRVTKFYILDTYFHSN